MNKFFLLSAGRPLLGKRLQGLLEGEERALNLRFCNFTTCFKNTKVVC